MRRARQGEAPEDMAALALPLRWSTLQSIFLSYAHLTSNTEHPGPRAVEEGEAEASKQALALLEKLDGISKGRLELGWSLC